MKFSSFNSNQLGILTPRDLQLFELVQNQTDKDKADKKQKENKSTKSFVRKTFIDIPEIETFEWFSHVKAGREKD